jgi:hypothetical protein
MAVLLGEQDHYVDVETAKDLLAYCKLEYVKHFKEIEYKFPDCSWPSLEACETVIANYNTAKFLDPLGSVGVITFYKRERN